MTRRVQRCGVVVAVVSTARTVVKKVITVLSEEKKRRGKEPVAREPGEENEESVYQKSHK